METPQSRTTPAPGAARPERGGCFGCAVSSSLGCGAFLAGALLAIALFAPQLLGGWAARLVETGLRDHVDGQLTVGGAELAWADDVRLRDVVLQSSSGAIVARGSVRLPSLTDALDDFEETPAIVRVRAQELNLRVAADGSFELARVLRFAELEPLQRLFEHARGIERGGAGFHFEVQAPSATLHDERTPAALSLKDLSFEVGRTASERPLTFALKCSVAQGNGAVPGAPLGELALDVGVHAFDAEGLNGLTLGLRARAVPTALLALVVELCTGGPLPWQHAEQLALLGPVLDADLTLGEGSPTSRAFAFTASSERGTAALTGQLVDGRLVLAAGPVLTWRAPEGPALAALARLLPVGVPLAPESPAPRDVELAVRLDGAALELGAGALPGLLPRPPGAVRPAQGLRVAALELDARCGVRGTFGVGMASYPLAEPVALVRYTSEAGGTARLHWRHGAGLASLTLRLPSESAGNGGARALCDCDLPGLPTALLEAHGGLPREGAALLGGEVRLVLEEAADGGAQFALYAGVGREPVRGEVARGVARAAGAMPQTLWFPSDPGTLERLIGPLLPWLTERSASSGGQVEVTFDDVSVPLDGGDLRPRGRLTLGLPELSVQVTPGLARLFSEAEGTDATLWRPKRFVVELNDEVVRYPSVEVPIGGDVLTFSGSFDRVTRLVDLEGEVPARLVQDSGLAGTEVGALLAESDWPVFVNVSGSVQAPRLLIDRAQWGRLLERAVPTLREAIEQLNPRDR